jgi:hypothetical protein
MHEKALDFYRNHKVCALRESIRENLHENKGELYVCMKKA